MFITITNFDKIEGKASLLCRECSVVSVVDGIVIIKGLDYAKSCEMVGFAIGTSVLKGIILNLTFD